MTASSPIRPRRRRRPRCAKATGSCMPTSAIPRATRCTWPPTWCRWETLARASSCAAAPKKWWKARFARAQWCLSFPAILWRSIAIVPPTIKPQPRCVKANPSSISSLSKDVRPKRRRFIREPAHRFRCGQVVTFLRICVSIPVAFFLGDSSMSDMRLIVAGAGGRMGRTLIHAVAATDGVIIAGAVEAASSAVIGRDAGELAGLGSNGVAVATDVEPLLARADGLLDFTVPAATVTFAEHAARQGCVHVIGTTGLTGENEALITEAAKRAVIVKSGNMSM